MASPPDCRYTREHEWVRVDGDTAVVGITDYAQQELGDVVFVDLPEPGARVTQGETFGAVESVKAASDLYSPVGGEVLAANGALADTPDLVNSQPFADGWMLKVRLADPADLDRLMDAAAYDSFIQTLH